MIRKVFLHGSNGTKNLLIYGQYEKQGFSPRKTKQKNEFFVPDDGNNYFIQLFSILGGKKKRHKKNKLREKDRPKYTDRITFV